MGECVFGRLDTERLQFNEKSLWRGGPSENRPDYRGGNIKDSYNYLVKMQEALKNRDKKTVAKMKSKLVGIKEGYGSYSAFGNINVKIDHSNVTDYKRYLDIDEGYIKVEYNTSSHQERIHFASFEDKVIVNRFKSEKLDLNLSIFLDIVVEQDKIEYKENTITAFGQLKDNGMKYYAKIVALTDGTISTSNCIKVENASFVDIYLTAKTNYKNEYPTYRGEDPTAEVDNIIDNAIKTGFDSLLERHQEAYRILYNRNSLNLIDKECNLDAPSLLANSVENKEVMLQYEEILYQYGRYLLISSSRGNNLPANLQGVWCDELNPAWSSDYHLNVNLQMCYWHAYVTNLHECAIPMIDYMNSLVKPGRVTAKDYHNIDRGWVCHTQNTPFGWTCPGWDFDWGWSPAASSWMMQNMYDYYLYTQDKEFLRDNIYPTVKENAIFWINNLKYDENQDRYVSSPSYSPEHGPVSIGNTYEQEIIYELFKMTLDMAKVLNDEDKYIENIKIIIDKIQPYSVGNWGQVKEWFEEDDWIKNVRFKNFYYKRHKAVIHHRHMSHLLGLYPYNYLSRDNIDLFNAAKVSIDHRGLGAQGVDGSGWSKVNKTCLWARLKNGENAQAQLDNFLHKNIANNLWDLHPPYQMDGNCGFTAAIGEMLIYSGDNYIELLPAIPSLWKNGNVSGICAKGGHEFSYSWENGQLNSLTISSKFVKKVKIYVNYNTAKYFNKNIGEIVEVEVNND